jgi:hypothetical protein
MRKTNTYNDYMQKVIQAENSGYSNAQIIAELEAEKITIQTSLRVKLMTLANNRSPYPAREARRIATECIMTINRVIKELTGVPAGDPQ